MEITNTSRCFTPMRAGSNGILQGDLPFNFALPLLTMQIAVVLVITRTVAALFKPIKQPQVLAEIVGGVLLGPTALGRIESYKQILFPAKSIPLLETVATIGLMFFIFMVGMHLDLQVLRKIGRKAVLVAATGMALPFVGCIGLASLARSTLAKDVRLPPLLIFLGGPLSTSAFSVLVRIMAELKLLTTDIAKLAIPIGAINDMTIWTLLAVGVAMAGAGKGAGALTPVYVILCAVGFGIFMFTAVRKAMGALARSATCPEGKECESICVCVTLMSVLLAGLCSDVIGVHALLGPFLLGLVLPKDTPFPKLVAEKIEDFVTSLFLPLFFASSGLKTNLGTLHGASSLAFLVLFFCTAAVGKILASFVSARLIGIPSRRALILGFLLNTKGLAVLIVLNVGRDLKVLNDELFAILVLTALLTSFVTTPAVSALCKPGIGADEGKVVEQNDGDKSTPGYGASFNAKINMILGKGRHANPHRCLASLAESSQGSSCKKPGHPQLRLLACAYEFHTHSSFINFLEAARGIQSSPLKLYPLRLSLLPSHSSTLFMLSPAAPLDKPSTTAVGPLSPLSFPPSPSLSDVTIRPLSSVTSIDSMHDDICTLAARKRAALILLPFCKPRTTHSSSSFSKVTQRVLDRAPCSVGILIDRGSMAISPIHPSFFSYKVVVLFVGGPDDREALFTGLRMVDHPGVAIKVVRLTSSSSIPHSSMHSSSLQGNDAKPQSFVHEKQAYDETKAASAQGNENLKPHDHEEAQDRLLDDEAISMMREQASESSFVYAEEQLASGQSLVEAVKALTKDMADVNMYIVGRGRSRYKHGVADQQLTELGTVGDVLASYSDEESHACVVVIQQHISYYAQHREQPACRTTPCTSMSRSSVLEIHPVP